MQRCTTTHFHRRRVRDDEFLEPGTGLVIYVLGGFKTLIISHNYSPCACSSNTRTNKSNIQNARYRKNIVKPRAINKTTTDEHTAPKSPASGPLASVAAALDETVTGAEVVGDVVGALNVSTGSVVVTPVTAPKVAEYEPNVK